MTNYRKKKSLFKYDLTSSLYGFINRLLITALLTIACLIVFKKNSSLKQNFYNKFLSQNFNFAYVNNLYTKYFGSSIPFGGFFDNVTSVFNESLVYDGYDEYLDGVSLNVSDNYLVPNIGVGLVIFIGEREGYGNTVIVQQSNGIDVLYGNLNDVSVKMYSYVSSGEFIGNCSNNLYLVFKKDGNVLDFKKYI